MSLFGVIGVYSFKKHFSGLTVDLPINMWEHRLQTEIAVHIEIEPAQRELRFTCWCDREIAGKQRNPAKSSSKAQRRNFPSEIS